MQYVDMYFNESIADDINIGLDRIRINVLSYYQGQGIPTTSDALN